MDEYKCLKKYLNKNNNEKRKDKKLVIGVLNRILISGILLLVVLCFTKVNDDFKAWINKNVYHTNISFAKINDIYKKYFGDIFPVLDLDKTEPVFNEKLTYLDSEDYKEGVKLTVSNNYLVPVIESGIVVFMGNKDNYGNVIIVQQVNGIDLWYVGIENSNIKIYDYIEKGSLLGEATSNEIYLYYQEGGEFLDYKKYL